eukprot:ANDGO_01229.mRNA.1 tRNA-dihydrouridine(16/17) synthase
MKLRGYDFFRSIGSPRFMVAPMVDQSELPFRLLCKNHGAHLGYTPMLNASIYSTCGDDRMEDSFSTCAEDRPVFAQFAANDPQKLLISAKRLETLVDAVDINLGCPQHIARRGHYGAFLMDEWDLIASMVKILDDNLAIPVTCKIRVFADRDKSVEYAKMIEAAGCSVLAVHGRTREQKGTNMGVADWDTIKAIKQALKIPVLANGNMETFEDVQRCIQYTGCDGVLSAEALLWNPALFSGKLLPSLDLCQEYVDLVRLHPCPLRMVKAHIFKILACLIHSPENHDLRQKLGTGCASLEEYAGIVTTLRERCDAKGLVPLVEMYRDRREESKKQKENLEAFASSRKREVAVIDTSESSKKQKTVAAAVSVQDHDSSCCSSNLQDAPPSTASVSSESTSHL